VGDLASIHDESGLSGITIADILTECGRRIDDAAADQNRSRHDILTGSSADGRLRRALDPNTGLVDPNGTPLTCNDWTSNAASGVQAWVGHGAGDANQIWNSQHDTLGCTEAQFREYVGNGGVYCFATN
jgi:hypothetical protein